MSSNIHTTAEGIVVLHFGPASLDFIANAAKLAGRGSVIDPQAAEMAGANIAAGTPAALAALKGRLTAGSIDAAKQQTHGLALPAGAAEWLGAGERGVSSNTIFMHLTGLDVLNGRSGSHPRDPDDFRRCELLLDAVPALRGEMHRMREVSMEWIRLFERWQDIVNTFDAECPGWRTRKDWNAPKTYALMRSIIEKTA
jgi:hypothetical protein